MKKVVLTVDFEIGDEVYLKTDPEQFKRIITSILVRGLNKSLSYELSVGDMSSYHVGCEISEDKDIMITTTN